MKFMLNLPKFYKFDSINMKTQSIIFGIFITLLGGIFWGFSGVCGQYLFEVKGVSANWLVPYRLFCAGCVLLFYCAFRLRDKRFFAPLKDKRLYPQFLAFSLLGLMLTQYFYFYSILSSLSLSLCFSLVHLLQDDCIRRYYVILLF